MFELNDRQRSQLYLDFLKAFGVDSDPECEGSARCAGHSYATAFLSDELAYVFALADAIDHHVGLARNALQDGAEPALDQHSLNQIVGARMASTAANIAGYFARVVGHKAVWSDAPLGHKGPFHKVSFAGHEFDGFAFVPAGGDDAIDNE